MPDETAAERTASLVFRLRDCMRILRAHADDSEKRIFGLLGLHEYEQCNGSPMTMSEIARKSGLQLPNVGRLLHPFEEDGLIRRDKRGRTVYVSVTEKGKELLEKSYGLFLGDLQRDVLSALDDGELQVFLGCFEKIVAQLEKKAKN